MKWPYSHIGVEHSRVDAFACYAGLIIPTYFSSLHNPDISSRARYDPGNLIDSDDCEELKEKAGSYLRAGRVYKIYSKWLRA